VADYIEGRAQEQAELHDVSRVYVSGDDLIENPAIEAVGRFGLAMIRHLEGGGTV